MFNRSRNSGAKEPGRVATVIAVLWYRLSIMAYEGASYRRFDGGQEWKRRGNHGKSTGVHPKFSIGDQGSADWKDSSLSSTAALRTVPAIMKD